MATLTDLAVLTLGLLALGGGLAWLAYRATRHTGSRGPQVSDPSPVEDRVLRHQAARVDRATERSAQIHREAMRLADDLRAYEAWRAGR